MSTPDIRTLQLFPAALIGPTKAAEPEAEPTPSGVVINARYTSACCSCGKKLGRGTRVVWLRCEQAVRCMACSQRWRRST